MAAIPFKVPFKRYRYTTDPVGESLTLQSMAAACDINNIMAKYARTGLIDHVKAVQGTYGDFSSVSDYQSAVMAVQSANEAFSNLPAKVRDAFSNDPHSLMSFLLDSNNRDKAIELGLIDKPISDDQIVPNPEDLVS